jgi:prephenate dehydratase
VPIRRFTEVIEQIAPYLTKDKVVMDVCSVKKFPVEVLEKVIGNSAQIIATHPMFGPTVISKRNSISGLPIVMNNVNAEQETYKVIINYFEQLGLSIIELTPDEHDRLQAETQYLAQKIKFSYSDLNIHEPTFIDTPAVKAIKEALQLMGSSRELLEDMEEYNPYCLPTLKKFVKNSIHSMKKIYYLGPKGSFNDILITKIFANSPENELVMCNSFPEVVEKVKSDKGSIGALGIENSISSDVHENMDIMFKERLCIIGEAGIKITMNLIGLKGAVLADIKEIYTHPQAILQCSNFLKDHSIAAIKVDSTAAGKAYILEKQEKNLGAIGSSALANGDDKVEIIESNIANIKHNMTRFIFISTDSQTVPELGENANKLTYVFQLKHEPGSLAKVLTELAKEKVNLTKIQSRPIPGTDWEYNFWVDMEIPYTTIDKVNQILQQHTLDYHLLGAYEKGKVYES